MQFIVSLKNIYIAAIIFSLGLSSLIAADQAQQHGIDQIECKGSTLNALALYNECLFLGCGSNLIGYRSLFHGSIFDEPVELKRIKLPSKIAKLLSYKKYLFVACSDACIYVIGGGDGNRLIIESTLSLSDRVTSVCAVENRLYFGTGSRVFIIDVADPKSPKLLHEIQTNFKIESIKVKKNYAYIAAGEMGFKIINLKNPVNSKPCGSLKFFSEVTDVAISSHYAYVTYALGGLAVIDISDPYFPKEVYRMEMTDFVFEITLVNNVAYVCFDGGICKIDIKNPAEIKELSSLEFYNDSIVGKPVESIIRDNNLFILFESGLGVLDLSKFDKDNLNVHKISNIGEPTDQSLRVHVDAGHS